LDKVGYRFVGETEWQKILTAGTKRHFCALDQKIGEIDPWSGQSFSGTQKKIYQHNQLIFDVII